MEMRNNNMSHEKKQTSKGHPKNLVFLFFFFKKRNLVLVVPVKPVGGSH